LTELPIRPVILCGGSGTRLWPLSRTFHPKQFIELGAGTLFGRTVQRASGLTGADKPIIVCNENHRFFAAGILQELGVAADILLEPLARNTAPAIALAALAAREAGEDPLLLVLPSDHLINPDEALNTALATAAGAAANGALVTFGVTPTRPETGYGYIRRGAEAGPGVFRVERFVEKPGREEAKTLLADGRYTWNSGMFLFRASTFLNELVRYAPAIQDACRKAWSGRSRDLDFVRIGKDDFVASPSDSIDYALMERTQTACVVPLTAEWNDLGSWKAFYEVSPRDDRGNARVGDVVALDSDNCYLHATHRLLATLGVKNLVIVETADAVLVADWSRTQEVKKVLEKIAAAGRSEADTHVKVYRPWGSYESLAFGDRFQVKRIVVNPGKVLSLQFHHHRAEHWVVVRGTAKITVNGEVRLLGEDQSTYIPLGAHHRMENPGRIPLEIIEVQTGAYLGEDDIVRLEDSYGRKGESPVEVVNNKKCLK
jgi:mannose-1-phosphate guanylyltransferase / mannose-6-phosphate isomerase